MGMGGGVSNRLMPCAVRLQLVSPTRTLPARPSAATGFGCSGRWVGSTCELQDDAAHVTKVIRYPTHRPPLVGAMRPVALTSLLQRSGESPDAVRLHSHRAQPARVRRTRSHGLNNGRGTPKLV